MHRNRRFVLKMGCSLAAIGGSSLLTGAQAFGRPVKKAAPGEAPPEPVYAPVPYTGYTPVSPLLDTREPFQQHCNATNGYAIQKATNFPNIYKFVVTGDGTSWGGDVPTSQRSEYRWKAYFTGPDMWSRFGFRFTSEGRMPGEQRWCDCSQFHRDPAKGQGYSPPPFMFMLKNDRIEFQVHTEDHMARGYFSANRVGSISYEQGRWYDFITHVRNGPDGDGLVEIWCDGVKVCDVQNIKVGWRLDVGRYFKFGVYTSPRLTGTQRFEAEYRDTAVSNTSLLPQNLA